LEVHFSRPDYRDPVAPRKRGDFELSCMRLRPVCKGSFVDVNEGGILLKEQTMALVRDNTVRSRFELDVEGTTAFANYRLTPQAVIITHTETPRALRGRGIASLLVEGALNIIRDDGRKVVAGCSFVADYLRKHPEFADLVG
jgi:predicted GNAT family acetyltransferase